MGRRTNSAIMRFGALPDTVRGALWMSVASMLFAIVYVTIRRLTQNLPIIEVVLFRAVLGIAFMAPWVLRAGWVALRTNRMGLYWVRLAGAYTGMLCWFYALANLTLADATSLMFTMPLFTILLAGLILRERIGMRRWMATFTGFAGALVIIRPGVIEVGLASLAALYTALSYAGAGIATKALTRTESTNAVVFYNFALIGILSIVPAAFLWKTPTWIEVPWILVFGVFSTLAQQAVTRAFAAAEASVVSPFNYLKLPFVAAIGFVWFAELPDAWTWTGAGLIIASTWYIARHDARRAMRSAAVAA